MSNLLGLIRICLFILGCILCTNALWLILQKKIHLGIVLPLLIGSIFLIHAIFWQNIQDFLKKHLRLQQLWKGLWWAFAIWLCSFFIFVSILKNRMLTDNHHHPIKAIIVLGSGIEGNQPSPTLAKRLDRAAKIAQQQPQAWMIVSGGIGFSEQYSEAEVMSNYLQHRYLIANTRILQESQSTSTELNLEHSQKILATHHISMNDPIAIVSSDFHLLRAKAIAQKQGYQHVFMYGATTPISIRYNAWLREYFAFISGWILREY